VAVIGYMAAKGRTADDPIPFKRWQSKQRLRQGCAT